MSGKFHLRIVIFMVCFAVCAAALQNRSAISLSAQNVLSPTPVRVQIATATALPTAGAPPSEIPATFTPTDQGPAQLEPKPGNEVNGINVRSDADIESDILGTIRTGERFTITGRVFRWIQFRYDPSPSGFGYVFDELIDIIGDESAIPDLTQSVQSQPDASILAATETAALIEQTPGFELTLTASARIIDVPSGEIAVPEGEENQELVILPTFTYPPNFVAAQPATTTGSEPTPAPSSNANVPEANGVAPIIPIVVLGGLGLIGLLLSAIRR